MNQPVTWADWWFLEVGAPLIGIVIYLIWRSGEL